MSTIEAFYSAKLTIHVPTITTVIASTAFVIASPNMFNS